MNPLPLPGVPVTDRATHRSGRADPPRDAGRLTTAGPASSAGRKAWFTGRSPDARRILTFGRDTGPVLPLGPALDDLAQDLGRVIETIEDDAARFRLVLVANALRNLAAATEAPATRRPPVRTLG